jgi:hypothetical protein
MIQLTELQASRDTLQRAMMSGVRRVQFKDQSVEYGTIDEQRKALADLDAQIANLMGTAAPRFHLSTHSRE